MSDGWRGGDGGKEKAARKISALNRAEDILSAASACSG